MLVENNYLKDELPKVEKKKASGEPLTYDESIFHLMSGLFPD